MCNNTTFSGSIRDEIHLSIDELARRGAQRMLALALQTEVDEYIRRHEGERDENGHAWVVRNGRAQERVIQCGAAGLNVRRSGSRQTEMSWSNAWHRLFAKMARLSR